MPENITTVPSLPDADFGGNPSDNLLYLIQGTGSDRDRKATLSDVFDGMLPRKIDKDDYSGHDIGFSFEDSRGGMVVSADIRNGKVTTDKLAHGSVNGWKLDETSAFSGKSFYGTESLGAPTVTATTAVKTPTVEGTTQGTTSKYLLVNSAMTVNGDADLKSNVSLGGTTMKVSLDDQKVEVNADAEVSGTLSAEGVKTAKISPADGTATVQVTGVLDAVGVNGTSVTTDSIVPKTSGNPVSVSGSLTASGSVTAGKLACSKLSLRDDGVAYAPAMPYFVDTSTETSLSRLCSGSPSGGRVTLVNATDGDKTYTFSGGANGKSGYFKLKAGRAVDLLVFATSSSTTSTCVPIGVDFSTGD